MARYVKCAAFAQGGGQWLCGSEQMVHSTSGILVYLCGYSGSILIKKTYYGYEIGEPSKNRYVVG